MSRTLATAGYTCPVSTTTTASQPCPHCPPQLLRCQPRHDGSLHITIAHLTGLTWHMISPHTDTSPRSSYNNGQETQFIILDIKISRMKVLKHVSPLPNTLGPWDWMTPPLWFGFLWSEHQRLFVRDCGYSRVIIFILHRHTRASSHGRTKPQPSRRVVLNCQNFFWLN